MSFEQKLDLNSLESVTGGKKNVVASIKTKKAHCPTCDRETEFVLGTGGRAVCRECNNQIMM